MTAIEPGKICYTAGLPVSAMPYSVKAAPKCGEGNVNIPNLGCIRWCHLSFIINLQ